MRFLLCLLMLTPTGLGALAECPPEDVVKVVFRDATPGVDPESFAARPKTLYRKGFHYLRLEEQPDPAHGIHGLIVTNLRDTWLVNLATQSGQHIIDTADSYNAHAPVVGGPEDSEAVREMEFGCEVDYMKRHGVEPRPTSIAGIDLLEYQRTVDKYVFRLLVLPDHNVPFAFALYEGNTLTYYLRYMEYGVVPDADSRLFAKPDGMTFEEAE